MSRAFHPPDTMSSNDIRKVADVRREIWKAGFKGLVCGSVGGLASHRLILAGQQSQIIPPSIIGKLKLNRNTALLSFMLGGAIGSFSMASASGKNNIHNLHDVMLVGSNPVGTEYQVLVEKAKEKEKLQHDNVKRAEFRLQRRKSLDDRHQWIDESELIARGDK